MEDKMLLNIEYLEIGFRLCKILLIKILELCSPFVVGSRRL